MGEIGKRGEPMPDVGKLACNWNDRTNISKMARQRTTAKRRDTFTDMRTSSMVGTSPV
jgi:hypothetical protein